MDVAACATQGRGSLRQPCRGVAARRARPARRERSHRQAARAGAGSHRRRPLRPCAGPAFVPRPRRRPRGDGCRDADPAAGDGGSAVHGGEGPRVDRQGARHRRDLRRNRPAALRRRYEWRDERLAVSGVADEVRFESANPCLCSAPATVRIREAAGEGPSERLVHAARDAAFRREWMHPAACIRNGGAPRTPLAGGLADLDLAEAIIKAMPALPREPAR